MRGLGRNVLAVGLIGGVAGAALVALFAVAAARHAPASVGAFVRQYDHRVLHDPFEIMLVQSDGQAFAALARDPSLARPEEFPRPEEAAYRAQRPLLPYAAWLLSLGRPSWVPPVLAMLQVAAVASAVTSIAILLVERGASPWLALLYVALPGAFASLEWLGPESLWVALLAASLVAWDRGDRGWRLACLLTLATMTRETALVGAVALAAFAWRQRRRPPIALATPFAAYVAWVLVLRVRIGAWPLNPDQERTAALFRGLADGARRWNGDSGNLAYALLALVLVVAAVTLARHDVATWTTVGFAALASFMGAAVWSSWDDWTRALLPLYAFALVSVAGAAAQARTLKAPGQRPRGAVGPGAPVGGVANR